MRQQDKKKKQCFIITPIGADNSDIRRHLDGIIDECIYPVFENEYDIIVAHKLSKPGSITNQIVEYIYNSDVIIANLTDLNPNVMYELAFAHSLRKNVIHIMENNGKLLPFDLVTERTIFYTNDFQGAIDLKKRLQAVLDIIINNPDEKIDNPIYNTLEKLGIEKRIIDSIEPDGSEKVDALNYIIERLNDIEGKINYNVTNMVNNRIPYCSITLIKTDINDNGKDEIELLHSNIANILKSEFDNVKYSYRLENIYRNEISIILELRFDDINNIYSNIYNYKLHKTFEKINQLDHVIEIITDSTQKSPRLG